MVAEWFAMAAEWFAMATEWFAMAGMISHNCSDFTNKPKTIYLYITSTLNSMLMLWPTKCFFCVLYLILAKTKPFLLHQF